MKTKLTEIKICDVGDIWNIYVVISRGYRVD